ncbi:MAG: sensor histidine kinase [Planctomycetaceae bacterium]|nr:MAG: sensor histidine kinase [Planctomycetaceae bacterium]
MLFTRTIRRKLLLGVGMVLAMLLVLSAGSLLGLSSYRLSIRALEFDILEAPQKAGLIEAISRLQFPLVQRPPTGQLQARLQQELFLEQVETVRQELDEFQRRCAKMPMAPQHQRQMAVSFPMLTGLNEQLDTLQDRASGLIRLDGREELVAELLARSVDMLSQAVRIPDPVDGMASSLEQARGVYRTTLVTVGASASICLVLFLSLLRQGFVWIFDPIRKLHQGALRVANGDFDYRVELKTRDEMAELAQAFNQMTARFQEIAADLDRQVQERSQQLVRSERLAGVGFLAAGVAHEINNPLSVVAMAAESLESRIEEIADRLQEGEVTVDPRGDDFRAGRTPSATDPAGDLPIVRQYLQLIQSESFRCKQITERLLDFSRGKDASRENTDLAHLVGEVVEMMKYLGKYRDKTIEFGSGGACYAEVNGPEIKQVILNLVANGLDAIQPGGKLQISLAEQTDHVVLNVHDDGCGMTADVMDHMFEPFFTSKQGGQGTGLGLSISHRIINQHGGTITASSPGPGQGSTFLVRIPRRDASARAAA